MVAVQEVEHTIFTPVYPQANCAVTAIQDFIISLNFLSEILVSNSGQLPLMEHQSCDPHTKYVHKMWTYQFSVMECG